VSLSAADIDFAKELFHDMPDLTTRKMFGGLGIYSDGTIFALLMSDSRFMIKAKNGPFAERLTDMGCEKWTYTRKDGAASSMPYYTMPEAVLDDPSQACALARDAIAALS
jgi:DNA transformation protein